MANGTIRSVRERSGNDRLIYGQFLRAKRTFVDALESWAERGLIHNFSGDDVRHNGHEWYIHATLEWNRSDPKNQANLRRAVYDFANALSEDLNLEVAGVDVRDEFYGAAAIWLRDKPSGGAD